MLIRRCKFKVLSAVALLVLLAAAMSCRGFFTNPTLTTLTVTPVNPSLELGQTLQMTATGTYDDGSTSTNVSGLSWSIDPTSSATISASGLVTPVAVSSTPSTITATSAAVSGTTSLTVVLANVTAITVMPSSQSISITQGTQASYTAQASISGQSPIDITGSAIWQVESDGTVAQDIQCTFSSPNEVCIAQTGATAGTYTVQVTYAGTSAVGTATLIVGP